MKVVGASSTTVAGVIGLGLLRRFTPTLDYRGQWLELRRKERAEREAVDSLSREVDSLTRIRKLVETDPGWQERIAREQYGMLRKGELEFTVVRPGRD